MNAIRHGGGTGNRLAGLPAGLGAAAGLAPLRSRRRGGTPEPAHGCRGVDITLDFMFYAAISLAFALADPIANTLFAAVLLASFIGTGSSFLAFAALAEKRGLQDTALPGKSFYFLGFVTKATETIAVFAAVCRWPRHFALLAYGFAGLCAFTTALRIAWGFARLRHGG